MKNRVFIENLSLFLLATAFSIGVAQASPSKTGTFQMVGIMNTLSGIDDIGPDGLAARRYAPRARILPGPALERARILEKRE